MPSLPTRYEPAAHEATIRSRWESSRAFHADPAKVLSGDKPPYCIVIPPPNVTARLHLGHALNNTIQDILARAHRMMGYETLWMPGTDHAGIATQTVVDRRLKEAGQPALADYKRMEAAGEHGRDKFIAKVQDWKDEYEQVITDQLKQMGCSCDWERQRFTMDAICARAVREAFFILFRDGLIYRGKRLVNWDPVTQTALADDEVEMRDVDSFFWYLKYPLVDDAGRETGEHITVATTRPETYLGDTAVAVNPTDPQRKHLIGRRVKLPFVNRIIPIIGDDYVVMPDPQSTDAKAKYASGFLKVTPAHDPNDEQIGIRHHDTILAACSAGAVSINVMAPDASISDKHGWTDIGDAARFVGLSREDARAAIEQAFKAAGLLEAKKPYTHAIGHSYRSHAAIEPYLSDQWYCKVTDDRLVGNAQRALTQEQSSSFVRTGGAALHAACPAHPRATSPYKPITSELRKTRRRLPHWQQGGSMYFITFRLREGELSHAERQIVLHNCMHWHGDRAEVALTTVMPDHVHMLLCPLRKSEGEWHHLGAIIQSIKSHSAREIGALRGSDGGIWQDEYFDRIIRDEAEFEEKWNYMINNPLKAGITTRREDYPFHARGEQGTARSSPGEAAWNAAPPVQTGDNSMSFHPARYAKTYESWHDNLRDWCISRQLWWGHRIPVWSTNSIGGSPSFVRDFERTLFRLKDEGRLWFSVPSLADSLSLTEGERESRGTWSVAIRSEHDTDAVQFLEAAGFERDPDVLDTWFSSGLWPLSTLGWPDPDQSAETKDLLAAFNPTNVLCTAREIITLWVSRMVMFNRYFLGQGTTQQQAGQAFDPPPHASSGHLQSGPLASPFLPGPPPFHDVFIHAMIQDGEGQKMSKSLGNGVDPLDIIESHGADAMRFVLCHMTTQTQDVRMPVDLICPHCGEVFTPKLITDSSSRKVAAPIQQCPKDASHKMVSSYGTASGKATPTADIPLARNTSSKFDMGRNFITKFWNAARFTMMVLEEASTSRDREGAGSPPPTTNTLIDRWMLSRLTRTITDINESLSTYQFSTIAQSLYDILWRDFCDWYLEAIKPTIKSSPSQQSILFHTLDAIIRLMHPVMPHVTEAIWSALHDLPQRPPTPRGLTLEPSTSTPALLCTAGWPIADDDLIDDAAESDFESLRTLIETIRQTRARQSIHQRRRITLHTDSDWSAKISAAGGIVETLAGIATITTEPAPPASVRFTLAGAELALSDLADAIDPAIERAALEDKLAVLTKDITQLEARLANPGYAQKAPAHLVQQSRDQLNTKITEREAAEQRIKELS